MDHQNSAHCQNLARVSFSNHFLSFLVGIFQRGQVRRSREWSRGVKLEVFRAENCKRERERERKDIRFPGVFSLDNLASSPTVEDEDGNYDDRGCLWVVCHNMGGVKGAGTTSVVVDNLFFFVGIGK